ncbi:tail fiber domain-containing protein (plasmid) [Citrobacter freundii]|nr:tail fiber domain-containing protein [Citrobacter freundii]QMR48146.1 tail fiber domain-containing protein [Citrobacter freundii]
MSAGTLTLTNNSAAVSGNGTAFTTELAAGDFIVVTVGGVPYTLPVKTVNSNTSLTLVSNYTGPTQSGAAWSAVPRVALNMVTAALVTQSAEALRGLNYDKQNWQSIFSGSGNITVKLPDSSIWTGPAWGGIATTLDGKAGKGANSDITSLSGLTTPLSVKQGGMGSVDAEGGRTNLGVPGLTTANTFTKTQTTDAGAFSAIILSDTASPADVTGRIWFWSLDGRGGAQFIGRARAGSAGQFAINLPASSGTLAVQGTSGRDYKDSIVPADSAEAMARVMGLALVNFVYKDDEKKRQRFGIIAEDAEKIAPQYIKHNQFPVEGTEVFDDEGNKVREEYCDRPSIDNNPIVMDLLGAVQYQQKMIKDMAESIKILESRLT